MKTYTVGHKSPDTDSIVSAIVAADFFGAEAAKAGDINNETKYILNRFGFVVPQDLPTGEKNIILVDHNSQEESLASAEEVIAIYDHHRLRNPFSIDNVLVKSVGCTATILSEMYFSKGRSLSKELASILICAILSDTLNFTSPTTKEEDREIVNKLNEIANLDIEKTAQEMFEAKSDISDIKTNELLTKDYKEFIFSGKKIGIGVWETVNTKSIFDRKDKILEGLKSLKEKTSLDYVYFIVVDIIAGGSELFVVDEASGSLARKTFGADISGSIMHLKGVVSRKKQITPKIEEALK